MPRRRVAVPGPQRRGRLSQESPFRRAETALHGLMEDLRANLPEDMLDRLTTGYVAMSRARSVLSLIHRDSG